MRAYCYRGGFITVLSKPPRSGGTLPLMTSDASAAAIDQALARCARRGKPQFSSGDYWLVPGLPELPDDASTEQRLDIVDRFTERLAGCLAAVEAELAAAQELHEAETDPPLDASCWVCPSCGSSDLRCEAPVTVKLNASGECTPLDLDAFWAEEISDELRPLLACLCNSCEHSGKLPDFERS